MNILFVLMIAATKNHYSSVAAVYTHVWGASVLLVVLVSEAHKLFRRVPASAQHSSSVQLLCIPLLWDMACGVVGLKMTRGNIGYGQNKGYITTNLYVLYGAYCLKAIWFESEVERFSKSIYRIQFWHPLFDIMCLFWSQCVHLCGAMCVYVPRNPVLHTNHIV